jgi:threonine dehydrogenase-like Zn-dependent dehydrogenase
MYSITKRAMTMMTYTRRSPDNRDRAIELVEDGMVDPMMMLTACLKWMSNDEVGEMLDANELSERFFEEDE